MAKTQLSFGLSECNRVKDDENGTELGLVYSQVWAFDTDSDVLADQSSS